MSDRWTHRGLSGTAATVIGLMALQTLNQVEALDDVITASPARWIGKQEPSTTGAFASTFGGTFPTVDIAFQAQLAEAYETFSATQKRLDPEFASLLVRNLWDLYAR